MKDVLVGGTDHRSSGDTTAHFASVGRDLCNFELVCEELAIDEDGVVGGLSEG